MSTRLSVISMRRYCRRQARHERCGQGSNGGPGGCGSRHRGHSAGLSGGGGGGGCGGGIGAGMTGGSRRRTNTRRRSSLRRRRRSPPEEGSWHDGDSRAMTGSLPSQVRMLYNLTIGFRGGGSVANHGLPSGLRGLPVVSRELPYGIHRSGFG